MARPQEVVLVIRLISIRFVLSWERKACRLIRFTFYSHAQWGIRDKSLLRLVHYKRSGVDNRTSSSITRQIHRIHGIGDHGSIAFSFLNLPLTHQTDHPEFWPVFSAIVLTHIIMSAPLCCQVQDARHLHFRLAHNQFYPAHAHLSVSCLKRLRVMVVCTRAFIERNRIKRHGLQSSVYFLFV